MRFGTFVCFAENCGSSTLSWKLRAHDAISFNNTPYSLFCMDFNTSSPDFGLF